MDVLSDDLASIYQRLTTTISKEEFAARVRQKVEDMSGLCDEKTAALLVAHELGIDTVVQIAQIDAQTGTVAFVGKLMRVSPTREFSRDGDVGYVANLVVSDATGSIRVVLWNDLAQHVEELQIGQTLKIAGVVRDGGYGLEVNAREIEVDESVAKTEIEPPKGTEGIANLIAGLNGVDVRGVILELQPVRTFSKRDGSVGKVTNVMLGDETGRVRVTLWDDLAENVVDFVSGDVLDIKNGYTRERYGRLEVHVGNRGSLQKGTGRIEFAEKFIPIRDVQVEIPCTVAGIIEEVGALREFTRGNGSVGKVRNIVVSDDTGEIRVALWGDKALTISEEDTQSQITLRDCMPKNGLNNQLELSVDWRSGLCLANKIGRAQKEHAAPQESADAGITGTVISSAMAVCVDNGVDYVTFDKAFDNLALTVGDEVTVVGIKTNDKFEAKSIAKLPQEVASRKLETIKRRLNEFHSSI
jgi:replication factor A1